MSGLSDMITNDVIYKGKLWKSNVLKFFSTADPGYSQSDTYIADNWLGYDAEFEKLGAEVQLTSPTYDNSIYTLPYSDVLRPLTDMSFLGTAKKIIISRIQFFAFSAMKNGSSYQNASVNTVITNSLTDPNQALVQTRYLNTIPITWFPNYFRPAVFVNDRNIMTNGQNYFLSSNKGDLSMGDFLPFSEDYTDFTENAVSSIKVRAMCGLKVVVPAASGYPAPDVGTWIKRFPLFCRIYVTYMPG